MASQGLLHRHTCSSLRLVSGNVRCCPCRPLASQQGNSRCGSSSMWQTTLRSRTAAFSNDGAPRSFDDDAASGLNKLRFNKRESELPEALRGLEISEDGFLIDTKTGKVINEFGATRFDVAVRALRGELDPAPWVENTERNPGVLMSKLINFPTAYTFQIVGKATDTPKEQFVQDMVAIISRKCETEVLQENITVQERLGGKYVSMSVTVVVRAPEIIQGTYDEIGKDSRVKMKF